MQDREYFLASDVINFVQNGLCVDDVFSFNSIGIENPQIMSDYKRACISMEQISLFIEIGYSPTSLIILKYLKNEIFADEVASFKTIGINKIEDMVKYKNAEISAKQISSFVEIGYSLSDSSVIINFIKNGHTATEILRTKQILSFLVVMFLVSICFGILCFMLINFETKLMDSESHLILKYALRIFLFLFLEFQIFYFTKLLTDKKINSSIF
jgi:hypothetical protein